MEKLNYPLCFSGRLWSRGDACRTRWKKPKSCGTERAHQCLRKVLLLLYGGVRAALVMFVTQLATAACDKDLENHLYRIRACTSRSGVAEEWKMHRGGRRPPAGPDQRAARSRGTSSLTTLVC